MEQILTIFKTREIASYIWLLVLIIIGLFNKSIRGSIKGLLKASFKLNILSVIVFSLSYTIAIVFILLKIKLWDWSLSKDIILWFTGSAFGILMSLSQVRGSDYFKNLLLNNFKILVVIQFILNTHMFSLWAELILVPLITMLFISSAFSENKEEFQSTKKVVDTILLLITLSFFAYSVKDIITEFSKFSSFKNLQSFLLPILLSVSFIPCAYIITLYMLYESFFVRLNFLIGDESKRKVVRQLTLKKCNFSIKRLNEFSNKVNSLYNGSSIDDIRQLLN